MQDDTKQRLAMIGGGPGSMIGAVHRFAARLDGHYQLVAGAFSTDAEKNRETGRATGLPEARVYADYRAMLAAESGRADGARTVVIATPNFLHFEMALACMEAGLDVICEKPMAVSVDQAQTLARKAETTGVRFLLTHNYSGYPLVTQARQMVAQGHLGEVHTVQVEYVQEWLTQPAGADNKQAAWRLDPARAGSAGALGDIGTHAWHLARYVSQLQPQAVSADLRAVVPGRVLDDTVHALVKFHGGARCMLWASQAVPGHENGLRLRVVGYKASLEWAQEAPNELWFKPLNAPAQRITRRDDWMGEDAAAGVRLPPGHPEGYLEAFANLYSRFAEASADAALPGTAEGVDGLHFIATCLESSQSQGAWITWPEGN